jgi:hypothetical protein
MRRKLLLLPVGAPFIVAVAFAVMWFRARTAGDKWFIQHVTPGKSLGVTHIQVTATKLAIENDWRPEFPGTAADQVAWEVEEAGWQVQHSRASEDEEIFLPVLRGGGGAGFAWYRHDTMFADRNGKVVGAETYRGLLIPLWAILAAGIAPGMFVGCRWSIRRWIGRRRQRSGRCRRCGYDLRGSAARCPECGLAMAFTTPPTAAA